MRVAICYQAEDRHLQQLQRCAPDWEFVAAGQERIARELLDADIFIGHAKVPVPWPEIVARGRLRWIQSSAAGMDHCLTPEVIRSGIRVTSASGLFANAVAEQTMVLLLSLVRRMPLFFRAAQRREFLRRPTDDLHGATVVIAGFGGNGRRIAEVLAPFECRIWATDLYPVDRPAHVERLASPEALVDWLPQAQVLILAVPLTDVTRGMVNAEFLGHLSPSAYLVNVARGPCVVERDLVSALTSGTLAGAGLDVTEVEPLPPDSPLWQLDNVVITPHVGAQSLDRFDRVTEFACENIRRYRAGQALLNEVHKELGFPLPESRAIRERGGRWKRVRE